MTFCLITGGTLSAHSTEEGEEMGDRFERRTYTKQQQAD